MRRLVEAIIDQQTTPAVLSAIMMAVSSGVVVTVGYGFAMFGFDSTRSIATSEALVTLGWYGAGGPGPT